MENFRNVLKKRIALGIAFNVLAVTFIVLTGTNSNMIPNINKNTADMIHGFQVGIFAHLQIIMLVYIFKYKRALKNEDELKELYIEENDERKKLIKDKIGGVGFNFILGVIATATVISGFFHELVFITLLGVLFFIVLVKGVLKIYYRNKF